MLTNYQIISTRNGIGLKLIESRIFPIPPMSIFTTRKGSQEIHHHYDYKSFSSFANAVADQAALLEKEYNGLWLIFLDSSHLKEAPLEDEEEKKKGNSNR